MIIEAPQSGMTVRKVTFKEKYGRISQKSSQATTFGTVTSISGASSTKMPAIRSIDVKPVSFKLKQPFVTAGGRKTETHNVQITLHLDDGTRGLAEASSSIAMPNESQENMTKALKSLIPSSTANPLKITENWWRRLGGCRRSTRRRPPPWNARSWTPTRGR